MPRVRVSVDIELPAVSGETDDDLGLDAEQWLAAMLDVARVYRTVTKKWPMMFRRGDTGPLGPHPYPVEIVGSEVID